MNFVGKFDANLPVDGPGAHANAHAHVETVTSQATHAPADAIIVPDANLLFTGDFTRSGVDLVLTKDHHELVLHDYFKGEKRAALSSPDGAHLTGDLVNALTGHVEYAQAGGGSDGAGHVIGHVSKLTGNATAVRNGVSIILNNGDNVEKGDVVQSGSDSSLGITFIDGTVFGLSSNARMVLNEMVYDPNGSNNSSLLSLVAGTISFVAGETAKHGDMKIDTPVATMGIRGTAVLVEIDFTIPAFVPGPPVPGAPPPPAPTPSATFQVLVEPDGTTGSYILFDKVTLTPLWTVNVAGQVVAINNGNITTSNAALSAEAQKIISDVFAQRFTQDTNTKTTTAQTDTITQENPTTTKLANGQTVTPTVQVLHTADDATAPGTNGPTNPNQHIDQAPIAAAFSDAFTEIAGVTGSSAIHTASGKVNFVDINAGDLPTVSMAKDPVTGKDLISFVYTDVKGHNLSLNAQQLNDIKAVEVDLRVDQSPGNTNNGSATWTYQVADGAFDFLAAGETLVLTYTAKVDANFAALPEITFKTFTITITGTNDVPVITTGPESVAYSGGKTTVGGNLQTVGGVPTTGTLAFTDVDLTDTHTVATALTDASMSGVGFTTLGMAALDVLAPTPMAAFEQALSAIVTSDSTGSGNGTITWTLADLPVYLADFIPVGEVLTLTYTVTVTDSQNTVSTQNVTVTITGTDTAAVVWIHTTTDHSPDGLWTTMQNWETGTVPIATDDVIIITDQLHGPTPGSPDLIPSYPVTIDATTQAVASSVTMNDFAGTAPELDILSGGSLTISTFLNPSSHNFNLSADSILHNSGTVTVVGGKMELLDQAGVPNQSAVVNSGTIHLGQGGDFQGHSSITNTGTIDVQAGTLNVLVDVANFLLAAPGQITVYSGATLALGTDPLNGAGITGAITGGTVTINGTLELQDNNFLNNGTLVNDGQINVTGTGNALHGDTVTANHLLEVMAGGALTIDQSSTVANGTTTVDSGSTLTLDTAAVSGGILSNSGTVNSSGTSALTGVTTTNNAGDLLEVTGGELTVSTGSVSNAGKIEVVTGTLDLDTVTVTHTSGTATVQVDGSGATLDLESATISGGKLSNSGTVNSSGTSALTGVTTTNNASDLLKVLDGELTVSTGSVSNAGKIEIVTGTLDLDTTTVTNTGGTGSVQVDGSGATLDLENATISGGILSNSGTVNSGGSSALTNVSINNTGTIEATSGVLTIDSVTLSGITNLGSIGANGGELDLTYETVTNGGILEAVNGSLLVINNTTLNNVGGTIEAVDPVQLAISTVNLQNATINGGTVATIYDGIIDAMGGVNTIYDATINNAGTLEATGGTMNIDATSIVNNTGTFEVNGGNLIVDAALSGVAKIMGTSMLELGANFASAYSSANIIFTSMATGTLKLDHSEAFHGTVSGLDDNWLDLGDITSGTNTTIVYSGDSTGGTLTVVNNADPTQIAHIHLTGDYLGSSWIATSDGPGGGTSVTEAPGAIAALDSHGNAVDGSAVTASITDGGQHVTDATYQWQLDGHDILNATDATYLPVEGDEGHALSVHISFFDALNHAETDTMTAGTVQATPPVITDTFGSASSTAAGLGVNLVTNGGFETGNFDGWTLSGNTGFSLISSSNSHGDVDNAWLGPIGSDGLLTQNISTVVGQHYTLDFWLSNDGGVQNDFSVTWNGGMLFPQFVNQESQPYTEYRFDVVGGGPSSTLQFMFRQDPAYWHLDDVSITSQDAAEGTIRFSDPNDAHTASVTTDGIGYLGTLSVGAVNEANGSGSVDWHFTTTSSEIQQFLNPSAGHPITQSYDVAIGDGQPGGTVVQKVGLTVGSAINDTFVFAPGIGQEMVFNFSQRLGNTDQIELDHFGISDFSHLNLQSTNNNHDTLINLGHNDSLLLLGVIVNSLHANDFILHA